MQVLTFSHSLNYCQRVPEYELRRYCAENLNRQEIASCFREYTVCFCFSADIILPETRREHCVFIIAVNNWKILVKIYVSDLSVNFDRK